MYTSERGETISSIAKRTGCSAEDIEGCNCSFSGKLSEGCAVRIPGYLGCGSGVFRKIGKNETLFGIAKEYGLSLNELLLANPYLNPAHSVDGQVIIVPFKKQKEEEPFIFVVTKNYPLNEILRRFNMSIAELRRLNPGLDVFAIKSGEEIFVREAPMEEGIEYYRLREGEDLGSVSKKLGFAMAELLRANPDIRPSEFCEGQRIALPGRSAQ